MPLITTVEHEVLNLLYRTQAMQLRLHTVSPGDTGSMAGEVAGGSYTPQPVTFTDPAESVPILNDADVVFPAMPGVSVAAISIHRASDGAMRAFGVYDQPIPVTAGDSFRVPAGSVKVNQE